MATVTEAQQSRRRLPITWQTLWIMLLVVCWGAIMVGLVGAFFFKWKWTGFQDNGNLWSWLQLLFAPVLAAVLPHLIREHHDQSFQKAVEQLSNADNGVSARSEPQIPDDHQQEVVLQAYLDRMSELLLNKSLRESQPGNDIREVARAWTLTALRRVGKKRKGIVLQFLHEACLIYKGKVIIDLNESDLRGADLRYAKLNGSELSGVDLTGANLSNSNLSKANLSGANLSGANLSEANLTGADLSYSNLSGANLHTDLTGANLNGATYQGSN